VRGNRLAHSRPNNFYRCTHGYSNCVPDKSAFCNANGSTHGDSDTGSHTRHCCHANWVSSSPDSTPIVATDRWCFWWQRW
jgi:hypothetical protein